MVMPRRVPLPERRSFVRENCRIHGVQGKGPLLFTCLGSQIEILATHYLFEYKAPVACIGFPDCHWCQRNLRPIIKGFIAARQFPLNYLFVCEITEAACRSIIKNPLYEAGLRGRVIRLKRKGDKRNSPVYPELENLINPDSLPEPFDIMPVIENAYNGGLRKVTNSELAKREERLYGKELESDNGHSREKNTNPSAALPVHGDSRAVVLELATGVGRDLPR